jgi:hypothetical protein
MPQSTKLILVAVVSGALCSAITAGLMRKTEERTTEAEVTSTVTGSHAATASGTVERTREVQRQGRIARTTRRVSKPDGTTIETAREVVTLPSETREAERAETQQASQTDVTRSDSATLNETVRSSTSTGAQYGVGIAVDPLAPRDFRRYSLEGSVRLGGLPAWLTLSGSASGDVRTGIRLEW